jgi:hypothetical protein
MTTFSAGEVQVVFEAQTAVFEKRILEMNKKLKSAEGSLSSLEKVAQRALAFLSVGVAVNFVKSAADAADASAKLADKLGLSTERLAAFQLAAEDAGVESATFAKLLTDSQRKLGEAAGGTGAAADAIRSLGLRVSELQKLSPDELFLKYADSINQLKSRSEQFAVAQDLFGKSAQEAFALISAGRPAIDEAAVTVDRLGLALSRVDLAKIEEANDKLGLLAKSSEAFGQKLAAAFAPFVTEFVNRLTAVGAATDGTRNKLDAFARAAFISFEIIANAAKVFDIVVSGAFLAVGKIIEGALLVVRQTYADIAILADLVGIDSVTAQFRAYAESAAKDEGLAAAFSENAAARIKSAADSIKSFSQIFAEADQIVQGTQARAEEAAAKQADLNSGLTGESRFESLQFQFDSELLMQEQFNLARLQLEQDYLTQQAEARESLDVEQLRRDYQEKERITRDAEQKILKVKQTFQDSAIGLLQALAVKSKAAAIALVLITKGKAIAEAIMNTEVAATAALAAGDPYTAAARAAVVRALGYASVAVIAGTGFQEIQNIRSSSAPGAPLGSPQNPVFTSSGSGSGNTSEVGATQRPQANITLVGIGEKGLRDLASELSKVLGDYDVRIRREG